MIFCLMRCDDVKLVTDLNTLHILSSLARKEQTAKPSLRYVHLQTKCHDHQLMTQVFLFRFNKYLLFHVETESIPVNVNHFVLFLLPLIPFVLSFYLNYAFNNLVHSIPITRLTFQFHRNSALPLILTLIKLYKYFKLFQSQFLMSLLAFSSFLSLFSVIPVFLEK